MDTVELTRALDLWIQEFRSAALNALADGCNPQDLIQLGVYYANSKANKRALDRQRLGAPIEVMGGHLPRS